MENIVSFVLNENLGMGVLVFVLVGLYRLIGRVLSIAEYGFKAFLDDFKRIADGIADIAEHKHGS